MIFRRSGEPGENTPSWRRSASRGAGTLHCTRKLLDRIGEPTAERTPPTTRLGDWYANLLFTRPEQLVIALSERTLLPVIVPAAPAPTLVPRIVAALGEVLPRLGISDDEIHAEQSEMAEVVIGKTASRRVLGVMNEFAFMMQHADEGSLLDVSVWLSHVIVSGTFPDQATREAFGGKAKLARVDQI